MTKFTLAQPISTDLSLLTDKYCSDECRDYYPYYGVAPHECFWRKQGGFENKLGTSTIEPFEKWPDNFLVEIDEGDTLSSAFQYGSCGVYLCPQCLSGGVEKHTTKDLLSKDQVAQVLTEKGGT